MSTAVLERLAALATRDDRILQTYKGWEIVRQTNGVIYIDNGDDVPTCCFDDVEEARAHIDSKGGSVRDAFPSRSVPVTSVSVGQMALFRQLDRYLAVTAVRSEHPGFTTLYCADGGYEYPNSATIKVQSQGTADKAASIEIGPKGLLFNGNVQVRGDIVSVEVGTADARRAVSGPQAKQLLSDREALSDWAAEAEMTPEEARAWILRSFPTQDAARVWTISVNFRTTQASSSAAERAVTSWMRSMGGREEGASWDGDTDRNMSFTFAGRAPSESQVRSIPGVTVTRVDIDRGASEGSFTDSGGAFLGSQQHEVRFETNTTTGRSRAKCSCGATHEGTLEECQTWAASHDLDDVGTQDDDRVVYSRTKERLAAKLAAAKESGASSAELSAIQREIEDVDAALRNMTRDAASEVARLAALATRDDDAFNGITYRSSGHDLSAAGERARAEGMSKAAVRQKCSSLGLDKEQTSIVLGGFQTTDAASHSVEELYRIGVTQRSSMSTEAHLRSWAAQLGFSDREIKEILAGWRGA